MAPLIRRTFPFSFLHKSDCAVQVGSAAWTMNAGVSHALSMAAVVGPKGHVYVIEPETANVAALRQYIEKFEISNLSIIQQGVWKDRRSMDLHVVEGATGAHAVEEIHLRREEARSRRTGSRSSRETRSLEIEVDTFDAIMDEYGLNPDFVNITINGGEYEVLESMQGVLARGTTVTFPIFGRRWFPKAFELLEQFEYDIVVCDSPPTVRGPGIEGRKRLRRSRKKMSQRLVACATKSRHETKGPREHEAKFDNDQIMDQIDVTFS